MVQWRFYLYPATLLLRTAATLLDTIIKRGRRVVIFCPNPTILNKLDEGLWTQPQLILHGTSFKADQPVWLTADPKQASQPTEPNSVLFLPESLSSDQRSQLLAERGYPDIVRLVDEQQQTMLESEVNLVRDENNPISCWQLNKNAWQKFTLPPDRQ